MMISRLSLLLSAWLALPLWAEIERAHDAHVHGTAEIRLAQDGAAVTIQIDLPGADAVGFEHPPRTREQASALAAAVEWLQTGKWVGTPDAAGCRFGGGEVLRQGFDDHGHSEDPDGHDHGHGAESGHAKLHGSLRLECARPAALAWIDIDLFDRFGNLRQVRLDHFTRTGQGRTILVPGNHRARLENR